MIGKRRVMNLNYGFVRMAVATPDLRVADCKYNTDRIIEMMRAAAADGVKLIGFPELCITSYTCSDLFLQRTLLEAAEQSLLKIAEACRGLSILAVVGLPLRCGQQLYNCAAVVYEGEVLGIVPKQHLPNYGEFYEKRHFIPAADENRTIEIGGKSVPFGTRLLFACKEQREFLFAVEICEDLWVPDSPSTGHVLAGATVIVNPSASDETIGKQEYRRMLVASQSARLVCAYLYASAGEGESTTDMVFSGHSLLAEDGAVLAESPLFQHGFTAADIDVERLSQERCRMTTFVERGSDRYQRIAFSMRCDAAHFSRNIPMRPFVPENREDRDRRCGEILEMQASGLCKRLSHVRCKTAVIGISGGLDSTLALLVAARAMDRLSRSREDIIAVTMPCFGTTKRTKTNAQRLCETLGVSFRTVPIADAVHQHFRDIGHDPSVLDVTYENVQARERTQVLMDIANATGGIVIGTGDLSELALGWATYNGDHMSMYGVNCSIPKTLVRHLVRYSANLSENPILTETLLDILDTPVSPELLPAEQGEISQKTEDIVGPYELHDFFLYYLVRYGFTPEKVRFLASHAFRGVYEDSVIARWLKTFLRRFFMQQFKRSCIPDGPKVGSVTLSPRGDWRMPSDACAALWMDWAEEDSKTE